MSDQKIVRETKKSTDVSPFKMEMARIDSVFQDATERLRKTLTDNSREITGDDKSVVLYLSEQLDIEPKPIYRLLSDNVVEVDEDGNKTVKPIKFSLPLEATRKLCYSILHTSIHELIFNTPAIYLVPAHLNPIILAFRKHSFEERAGICDRITDLTAKIKVDKRNLVQENDPDSVFYRALDELLDDQYLGTIEQLNGYELASSAERGFFLRKAAGRKRFRLPEIAFLASHQGTSMDRFISELYVHHTDLGILEDYVPKKLSDIDFFIATAIKEYMDLNVEARNEVFPYLIRECFDF